MVRGFDVQNAYGEAGPADIGCGRARTPVPDHEAFCRISEHQDDQDQRRHDGQMQAAHLTDRRGPNRTARRFLVLCFFVFPVHQIKVCLSAITRRTAQ